jgi:hypothetical protein
LQQSKQELFIKWKNAFNDFALIEQVEAKVVKRRFSKSGAYDLAVYAMHSRWPNNKMSNVIPAKSREYCLYGFDENNIPVIVKEFYGGELIATGIFNWDEDNMEYVEFSMRSRVPSVVKTLCFQNGQKVLFSSLHLNGRGVYPIFETMSQQEIIEFILKGNHNVFIEIEKYEYHNNVLVKSLALSVMPGIDEYFSENGYDYEPDGKLSKITRQFDSGKTQITYQKSSGKSLKDLTSVVAALLADHLIKGLIQARLTKRLFCVQLSYQYCFSYWPYMAPVTEEMREDALNNGENLFPFGEIYKNDPFHHQPSKELEECFAEFIEIIEGKEDWEAGRKMLMETGKLMTESKLNNTIPVTADFIVFPIEWAMDDHKLEKTLAICGAKKEHIKKWKKAGWLNYH